MNELVEIYWNFKKSPLKFLKNNLNLIVILPAVLGGLWQVIELSRISFSFIRFFSVSQIVPDGLLILLFLIIFSVSVFTLFYFWKKLDDNDDNEEEQKNVFTIKKGRVLLSILFVFLVLGCILVAQYANDYFIENIEKIPTLFLYFPVNIIITLLAFVFTNLSIYYCKDIELLYHFRKVAPAFSFVLLCIQASMLFAFMVKFHNVFLLPAELKNIDNLICKAEKIENSATFEILYSNDKYIFVKCHKFVKDRNGKSKPSEIRIFKFEDLLDDSACTGNKRMTEEIVKDSIRDSKIPIIND